MSKRTNKQSKSERHRREADSAIFEDRDNGPIVAPEHKGMETKGIPLAGRITLDQYEQLVRRGYDGDVVRRWTQYHADQELRRNSALRSSHASEIVEASTADRWAARTRP